MLAQTVLCLAVLASSAQAAPFENLKEDLASCLRFEMGGVGSKRGMPSAVDRCSTEVERLDRADGRRLRGDGGLSPSSKAAILGVLGRGAGVRNVGLRD